jgi:hypothetical protein
MFSSHKWGCGLISWAQKIMPFFISKNRSVPWFFRHCMVVPAQSFHHFLVSGPAALSQRFPHTFHTRWCCILTSQSVQCFYKIDLGTMILRQMFQVWLKDQCSKILPVHSGKFCLYFGVFIFC